MLLIQSVPFPGLLRDLLADLLEQLFRILYGLPEFIDLLFFFPDLL